MKAKIDFGATTEIPEHIFQEIIHTALDMIRQHGNKCCKATIYFNEYDEDGRCCEALFSYQDDAMRQTLPGPFTEGLLLRNKRYSRNETTATRLYVGKFDNEPEAHLYKTFESV